MSTAGEHAAPTSPERSCAPGALPPEPIMPPAAEVTMDDIMASVRRSLDAMYTASENVAKIRVRRTSERGEVTVEVDGVGNLIDLQLTDAATSLTAERLGALIVSIAHDAAGEAFAAVGTQISTLNEILAE